MYQIRNWNLRDIASKIKNEHMTYNTYAVKVTDACFNITGEKLPKYFLGQISQLLRTTTKKS